MRFIHISFSPNTDSHLTESHLVLGLVALHCSPSTEEAEAGGLQEPGLHSQTLSPKQAEVLTMLHILTLYH